MPNIDLETVQLLSVITGFLVIALAPMFTVTWNYYYALEATPTIRLVMSFLEACYFFFEDLAFVVLWPLHKLWLPIRGRALLTMFVNFVLGAIGYAHYVHQNDDPIEWVFVFSPDAPPEDVFFCESCQMVFEIITPDDQPVDNGEFMCPLCTQPAVIIYPIFHED